MAGVYISYPFCEQKCTYCNFASGVFPNELKPLYQQRLVREILETKWDFAPETVYLGGGTPSLWDLSDLEVVLKTIPATHWKEATMEAAPGTLSRERVLAWKSFGINRVSLGVQSMVSGEIRRTGRKHTAEVVENDVALLRDCGIFSINLDLIAGLAGQTRESWLESVDAVLNLQVPHVSVYILEVDEDSRLGAEVLLNGMKYGAPDIPSEESQVWMYETAVEKLKNSGIERYEISNFAQPGHESLHNLKYWKLEPYVGFGADAHSFDGRWRWQNVENIKAYTAGGKELKKEPADVLNERYWVGLRLSEGVDWDGRFDKEIEALISDGLLEKSGNRLRLTSRGVLLSNEVFEKFLV